jgi:peptidoglycan/LPS O-acetylase OafA/YrhL
MKQENKPRFHLGWTSEYRERLFGVGMLLIILGHFGEDMPGAIEEGLVSADTIKAFCMIVYWKYVGGVGVEVFLFLSGMGLYYSFSRDSRIGMFYQKRLVRIMPAYLIVGVLFWSVKDFHIRNLSAVGFLKDISFVSFFSGTHTIWYIGFILVMYLLFPLFYSVIYRSGDGRLGMVILLGIYAVLVLAVRAVSPELYGNVEIALLRVPIFLIGIFMAQYIKRDVQISYQMVVLYIAAVFVMNYFVVRSGIDSPLLTRHTDILFGIGVLLLTTMVLQWLRNVHWLNAVLSLIGAYSLELYMTHVTLRNAMKDMGFEAFRACRISAWLMMLLMAVVLSAGLKKICDHVKVRDPQKEIIGFPQNK